MSGADLLNETKNLIWWNGFLAGVSIPLILFFILGIIVRLTPRYDIRHSHGKEHRNTDTESPKSSESVHGKGNRGNEATWTRRENH